jgi:hypothetical protein
MRLLRDRILFAALALAGAWACDQPKTSPAPPPQKPAAVANEAGPVQPPTPPRDLGPFLAWANQAVANLESQDAAALLGGEKPTCYPEEDPTESARGMCQAEVTVRGATYTVNWLKKEPSSFKLGALVSGQVVCEHLMGKEASTKAGLMTETRCALPNGNLALVETPKAGPTRVSLFTDGYLKRDPDLEQ